VRGCGSVFLAVKGDTNDFGTQGPDYSLRVMHRRRREIMGIPAVPTTKFDRQGGTTRTLERLSDGVPDV
jgi:hypothetical protein